MASFAVRMPPATLTPTRRPVASAKSRTADSITSATGGVAAGVTLPVEVLMKSAPASIASQAARRVLSRVASSPVSRITLRCVGPHASRTARTSSYTCAYRPARNAPRSMTMSTSSAPAFTASATSASFTASEARPDGNAVATEATATPLPASSLRASPTRSGYTHTAATGGTEGSEGSGWRALAHSPRILPGVSAPSSVVRSTMRTAISSAHSLASRLIERVARDAARSCAPTWSTPGRPCRICRSAASEPTMLDPVTPGAVTPPVTPAATAPAAPVTTSAFMPLLSHLDPVDDRGDLAGSPRADLDGVPERGQRRVEPGLVVGAQLQQRLLLFHPVPRLGQAQHARGSAHRVLLAGPAGAEPPGGVAHRAGVQALQPACGGRGHRPDVPGHRQRGIRVPALCGDHVAVARQCLPVGQHRLGVGVQPGQPQHLPGQREYHLDQIGRPVSGQGGDGLLDLHRVAYRPPERDVHPGQQRGRAHPVLGAEGHHGLRQQAGILLPAHEGTGAHLDVEHQGAGALGDLLRHDRAGDERDGLDGASHVPQRVEPAVRGR